MIILFPLMTTWPKFLSIVTLQVKFGQMLAFFVAKDVSQDNVPSGCINRLILPCREKLYHFCSCHLFVSLPVALPRSKYKCLASGGKIAFFSLSVVCKYTVPNRSWRETHRRFKTYFVWENVETTFAKPFFFPGAEFNVCFFVLNLF